MASNNGNNKHPKKKKTQKAEEPKGEYNGKPPSKEGPPQHPSGKKILDHKYCDVPEKSGKKATLLSEEWIEKFCKAIRRGNYFEVASRACGRCTTTVYNWLSKGEYMEDENNIYRRFYVAFHKAKAQAEDSALRAIRRGIRSDDPKEARQSAAWFLQHRYPKRWGRRVRTVESNSNVSVSGHLDLTVRGEVKVVLSELSDDELALLKKLQQRGLSQLTSSNGNGNGHVKNGKHGE